LICGKENKPCKPVESIVAKTKFKAISHATDGKTYILFELHEAGKPFTTIELKECLLGEKVPITGDLVADA
jgi:hypothetical protein